ncbi:MAG: hypothetical protein PHR28_02460 [candidate division Zixibacteria bacterium]|nr:hypothetical protein [candidate division Zixibacteria bacterium]
MRKKSIVRFVAVLLVGLIPLIVASGCAEKIVANKQSANITVAIDAKGLGAAEGEMANAYRLTVEGADFEPIVTTLELQGNLLTGQIEVPLGTRRHFIAEGLTTAVGNVAAPVVLYRGEAYADIVSSGATNLAISLRPVVPMVKLTPTYQYNIMNDSFYVDVLVYNLPNIRQISIVLTYNNGPFSIYDPTAIIKGASLDSLSQLSWSTATETVYLNVNVGDRVSSLTDASGYAHLARMQLSSYADWGDSVIAVVFQPSISSLTDLAGDPVSTAGIYSDQAVVEMHAPILSEAPFGGPGNESGLALVETPDGGIVAAGYTDSYGAGSTDAYLIGIDPAGQLAWEKTFGASSYDGARALLANSDGGYAVAGYTYSFITRSADVLLVKTDASGAAVWEKSYGGPLAQGGHAVARAPDEGYLVAGYAAAVGSGVNDVYAIKIDSAGNSIWNKTYGGTAVDEGHAVCRASDGGYIIVGDTYSFGAGSSDVYMLKIDEDGNLAWQKTFGGSADERGSAVAPTRDGGYIIAGRTFSFGAGILDMYLVKTDAAGNLTWQKTFGGPSSDEACAVAQTSDGGYAVAGFTDSFGAGNFDAHLVKTDASGNKLWQKTYGGAQDDGANCLTLGIDGGFILAGWTNSYGHGGDDLYLVRTDSLGNLANR